MNGLCTFLNQSYTAYHTTHNVCKLLQQHGFSPLTLGEKWNLSVGSKHYVCKNGSSVVAFVVGKQGIFNICESHSDSPSFKVKGNCVVQSAGAKRINTEKYGGGLMYTYFDRPLKVAGRVVVETENGIEEQLVESSYNVVIPSLAIHHNPTANDSFAVNPQVDTWPLVGEVGDLHKTLASGKVLDADLYVVPATQAFFAGANNEYLCSPRLDNLTSAYTSMVALANSAPTNIAVVACLDNEEIGSGTRQGTPLFIQQVCDAICNALGLSPENRTRAYENGFCLSVDNGHAVHPAHPEKSEPNFQAKINCGIVVKHHVNYSTDGLSGALAKKIFADNGVAFQDLYNRSDLRCGSTLGLSTARTLGIRTCDIGLAQLAMHSACETVGTTDVETMQRALEAFLNSPINGTQTK